MFRFTTRRMLACSLPLLAPRDIPEGFEFFEHKVVDKDLHASYEAQESLRLTITRQDEFLYKEHPVKCVTISTEDGDCGIFPGHEYQISKIVPSPITVEFSDGDIKKFFTSGGFAHINNEGSCDINCVECIPLSELSAEAATKELAEQQAALASAKDEKAKSIAEIRIGVLEGVINALRQN